MIFLRRIERGVKHVRADGAPDIRDLLRPLVNQQNHQLDIRVIFLDGAGDFLQEDRLARFRRRDDPRALAKTDGRDKIHQPHGRVSRLAFPLQRQPPVGVNRRQRIKRPAHARNFGVFPVDGFDVHQRVVSVAHPFRPRLADDFIAAVQVEPANLRDGNIDVVRAGRSVLRAQKAVAAGLHFQQAVAAAQQPRLEHLRHNRVARAVFLVVKSERLGLVQPDVRLFGGRLRRLHPASELAKQRLDHLRLVHPVGQAHLVGARQLTQLHHRHVLINSCGFQFDFSSSQWANMLCRGVSRGCAFMVKDMPKSIKIYVI